MQFVEVTKSKWYEFWKFDLQIIIWGMELPDKEFVSHLKKYATNFPDSKKRASFLIKLKKNAHVEIGEECWEFLNERFPKLFVKVINYEQGVED